MYCVVCERESHSPSAWCESCGYPLTDRVRYCVNCRREASPTVEDHCSDCDTPLAEVGPEGLHERAVEWSDTALPAMEGCCHGCGREIEADQSFCHACETEINAAAQEDCDSQSETILPSELENCGVDGTPPELGQ